MKEILFREILFRGKDIHGEWHYGDYLEESKSGKYPALESMHYIAKKVCRGELPELKWIIPETRGEFTGLTDKNGTKIFEGDIVLCRSRLGSANCVVIFEEGEYHLVPVERYKDYQECSGYHAIHCFEKKVIGNIHDNPELLEGE